MNNFKKKVLKSIISIVIALVICLPLNYGAITDNSISKIDKVLLEKMENCSESEMIPVSVWFTDIDYDKVNDKVVTDFKDKVSSDVLDIANANGNTKDLLALNANEQKKSIEKQKSDSLEMQNIIVGRRKIAAKLQKENNEKVMNDLFSSKNQPKIIYSSKYAPNVDMYLTKEQINDISKSSDVVKIYYADPDIEISVDEITSDSEVTTFGNAADYPAKYFNVTGISSTRDAYGLNGTGVNVGVFDTEFTNPDNVNYFSNNNVIEIKNNGGTLFNSPGYSHGNLVSSIIAGQKIAEDGSVEYEGAAPKANMYWAIGGTYSQLKASIEHLIYKGCNVINASVHIDNESLFNKYDNISAWIDHISTYHSIHMVVSSGNSGISSVNSLNMASNAITVGNCNNSGVIDDDSSYTTSTALPYKPDLVAPGVDIETPAGKNTGTSFSAPMVTGAVAQFCQLSAILRDNPNLMKALLLSSSKRTNYMIDNNVQSLPGTSQTAFDRRYGSGMLYTMNMYVSFHDNSYYTTGTMTSTQTNTTVIKRLSVKNTKLIRIAVVWDRISVLTSNDHSSVDGMIIGNDNITVKVTATDGTYYETTSGADTKALITFTATKQTGNYTIELTRLSSSNRNINYAISYSVAPESSM